MDGAPGRTRREGIRAPTRAESPRPSLAEFGRTKRTNGSELTPEHSTGRTLVCMRTHEWLSVGAGRAAHARTHARTNERTARRRWASSARTQACTHAHARTVSTVAGIRQARRCANGPALRRRLGFVRPDPQARTVARHHVQRQSRIPHLRKAEPQSRGFGLDCGASESTARPHGFALPGPAAHLRMHRRSNSCPAEHA